MAAIELGGSRGGVALVDDELLLLVSRYRWHCGVLGYVRARVDGKVEMLHRVVIRSKGLLRDGLVIDHMNGDKLDNRLANLRVCRQFENARNCPMKRNNSSGVTGVCWMESRRKWVAHIKVNRRYINLGYFASIEAAKVARLAAERRYFGEFAYRANPRAEIEIEPIVQQDELALVPRETEEADLWA